MARLNLEVGVEDNYDWNRIRDARIILTKRQLLDRWYHGAEGFLEKARIEGKRITTVITMIDNIELY